MKTIYFIVQGSEMEHPSKGTVVQLQINDSIHNEATFSYDMKLAVRLNTFRFLLALVLMSEVCLSKRISESIETRKRVFGAGFDKPQKVIHDVFQFSKR